MHVKKTARFQQRRIGSERVEDSRGVLNEPGCAFTLGGAMAELCFQSRVSLLCSNPPSSVLLPSSVSRRLSEDGVSLVWPCRSCPLVRVCWTSAGLPLNLLSHLAKWSCSAHVSSLHPAVHQVCVCLPEAKVTASTWNAGLLFFLLTSLSALSALLQM